MNEWVKDHAAYILVSLLSALVALVFWAGQIHERVRGQRADLNSMTIIVKDHLLDHPPRHPKYTLNRLPEHGGPQH